jgi:hypothetical protein
MARNPNFADWYRSAGLTPPEGLLDSRWKGVEQLTKQPKPTLLLGLAGLFALPRATETAVPEGFREVFRAHDEYFPSKNNLQELRVLAGATLREVIDQRQALAPLAGLALVCGAFGPREAALPEREHLEIAQRFLVDHSRNTRKCVPLPAIDSPVFNFTAALPSDLFAVNQTPSLHEPLINVLTDMGSKLSSAFGQAQTAIKQIGHTANVREEEVGILWWLQTHFSGALRKSFSEIGYTSGAFILPMELADLTKFVPGAEVVTAVLVHALQLAGAGSSSEMATIADVTNATPREWRERVCTEHECNSSALLSPILLAIHTSLKTDGNYDWLPIYRKACDIPVDKPFPLIQISGQVFRERMLLRATAEAKP